MFFRRIGSLFSVMIEALPMRLLKVFRQSLPHIFSDFNFSANLFFKSFLDSLIAIMTSFRSFLNALQFSAVFKRLALLWARFLLRVLLRINFRLYPLIHDGYLLISYYQSVFTVTRDTLCIRKKVFYTHEGLTQGKIPHSQSG